MPKYAFFEGKMVPFQEAKISVATHGFNYGTAVFEGIRGFWNAERRELFVFALKQHYERLLQSCKIIHIKLPYTVSQLVDITLKLLQKEGLEQDVYVRPLAYKSSEKIGVKLSGLENDITIFAVPFGSYFKDEKNVRAMVSGWRRIDDNAVPARAKITGAYINSALTKTEALLAGLDEGIVLNPCGHVAEASAANLFIVRNGALITPPVTANILEGITRQVVIILAEKELDRQVVERDIDRTELYVAEEVGVCGTACNISAVTSIDNRPVGEGKMGSVVRDLRKAYFQIVRGDVQNEFWADWVISLRYSTPLERLAEVEVA